MSHMHDIDNDEPLFEFDSFEDPLGGELLQNFPRLPDSSSGSAVPVHSSNLSNSPGDDPSMSEGRSDTEDLIIREVGKGKALSEPMPIRTSHTVDQEHDLFDLIPSGSGSSNRANPHLYLPSSSSPITSSYFDFHPIHTPLDDVLHSVMSFGRDDSIQVVGSPFDLSHHLIEPPPGKGKGRELPPTLPPLIFSPTEFNYSQVGWPSPGPISPTPGPSSYGSGYGSPNKHPLIQPPDERDLNPPSQEAKAKPSTIRRMPSRRRSFSSLSTHSTRSLATLSMSRIKGSASKVPGTLARKLLFRKRQDTADTVPESIDEADLRLSRPELTDVGHGSCFMPWRGDFKSRSRDTSSSVLISSLNLDLNADQTCRQSFYRNRDVLGVTGRSYSSPLPQSFLDVIAPASMDIFTPITILIRNYFEEVPRELQLQILSSLVVLHEVEHDLCKAAGQWTVLKATSTKSQWVGREKGIRELVKLSRVSKSWQALVFDGQLWLNLDLHSFPSIQAPLIVRLSETAGAFIQTLDFRGHTHLLSATLSDLIANLCLKPAPLGNLSCTQLTAVNLQGCSGLTTRSLHHLLIRSPLLQKLSLKGLSVVTNTTCDVLAAYCPRLLCLDLSRCSGMDGGGLLSLASAAVTRHGHLLLKELRVCGLKHINDTIMATLGKAAPYLEVLDLSYARQLHNSALEAFVSCEEEGEVPAKTVTLTSREAGRDSGDSKKYRRRVTRLRHLSLSACILLTDNACSNLAFTMPNLEFLELAGIGTELKDDGLVRLLSTTPFIRRLDLEDATDITDNVIAVLTPNPLIDPPSPTQRPFMPQPGHALEHLTISHVTGVSDDALLALVRGCSRLKTLEADNTPMSGVVMREFVQLTRRRQIPDAKIVAIDCRGITESLVRDLAVCTRPRMGWRAHDARRLRYLDGRDGEDLKVGQDECDEMRVVLKTFYSWQTVDQVKVARVKKRKANSRRALNDSNGNVSDLEDVLTASGRTRWWSPGGARRTTGGISPGALDTNLNDGCRIM